MVVISHTTAFEYWRRAGSVPARRCALPKGSPSALSPGVHPAAKWTTVEIEECLTNAGLEGKHFSKPFHVINPETRQSRSEESILFHSCEMFESGSKLPECLFVKLSKGLYAVSPELCFLQMAELLDVDNLVFVGCELCSMYRYVDEEPGNVAYWGGANGAKGSKRLPKIRPLITPVSIKMFLEKCVNVRGKRKAQRAARYITSNAASPMEYMLAQALRLPYLLGGYGLPAMELNREVSLGRYAGRLTRRKCLIPDLYWPQSRLDVEYASTSHHTSRKELAKDAERHNALGHLGIRVISVTWEQFVSLKDMDAVALAIGKHLGKRFRPRLDDYPVRKIYLHSKMLHYIRTGQFLQPDLYA